MGLFSEELAEMDRNTISYMIEELEAEVKAEKEKAEATQKKMEEKIEIMQKRAQKELEEKEKIIAELNQKIKILEKSER